MPNWVFNKVKFYGKPERIKELRDFVTTTGEEDTCFDFNKIVPMPDELMITSGSDETIAKSCAVARRQGKKTCAEYEKPWADHKTFNEWADIGEKYLSNVEKYGYSTWYGWRCNNWGTKWNASEPVWESDDYVTFNTAWSTPVEIYQKLAKLFPDIEFEVEYADEDLGCNCGVITYQDANFFEDPVNDFDFACNVWGYDPDEMREEYAYDGNGYD